MKRLATFLLTALAIMPTALAEYEWSSAPIQTIWDEDSQKFSCHLEPSKKYAFEHFGCYTPMGGHNMGDIGVAGQSGYSKELRLVRGEIVYGGQFDFCRWVGENWRQISITIQMKDKKKKLTGTCDCKGEIFTGEIVRRAFSSLDNPDHQKLARIFIRINLSDLHCKDEPDPNTLEHETFIAQALYSSDIKSIELANGQYKFKLDPFHSQQTLKAMFLEIAECCEEMSTYFPGGTTTETSSKKLSKHNETENNNNHSLGNFVGSILGSN